MEQERISRRYWMFGVATLRSDELGRVDSPPGCVTVSDARLPVHEREVLAAPLAGGDDPSSALRAALFVESFQTAVDGVSGTARSQSLRGVELVVPLTLQAEIGLACAHAEEAAFWQHLTLALPLVRSIGAMKTRGHGRVALAWAQEQT